MNKTSMLLSRLAALVPGIAILMAAISICFLCSCYPEWLDNDNYIYVTRAGSVEARNIKTRKTRKLFDVRDAKNRGQYVYALSPDKSKLAFAIFDTEEESFALKVRIFGVDGKGEIESDSVEFDLKNRLMFPDIFWTANGNRIVVTHLVEPGGILAVYDVKNKKLKPIDLKGESLAPFPRSGFPGVQTTPDGKSIIVATRKKDELVFKLMSLESGKILFEFKSEGQDLIKKFSDPIMKCELLNLPAEWKNDVLVFIVGGQEGRLDLKKQSFSVHESKRGQELVKHIQNSELGVVGTIGDNLIVEAMNVFPMNTEPSPITLYNRKTKRRIEFEGMQECFFAKISLSPDGKRAMIFAPRNDGLTEAVVVDLDGKLIDQFEIKSTWLGFGK